MLSVLRVVGADAPVQSKNREEKSLAQNKDLEQTWNSYSNELEQIVSRLVRPPTTGADSFDPDQQQ